MKTSTSKDYDPLALNFDGMDFLRMKLVDQRTCTLQ